MCKFYAVKKQDGIFDEGRVSGDGESLVNEEDFEKSRCPSWERMPGDGCISDIAEEDEDSDKEEESNNYYNCEKEVIDEENESEFDENDDGDYDDCDELDEGKSYG